jgi:hypothetical protein
VPAFRFGNSASRLAVGSHQSIIAACGADQRSVIVTSQERGLRLRPTGIVELKYRGVKVLRVESQPPQAAASDHLVGASEQIHRHSQTDRFGGLEIDRQLGAGKSLGQT